jgi:hypothetical protein
MLASVIASSEFGIKLSTLEFIPVVFTPENAVVLVTAFQPSLFLKNSKRQELDFAYFLSHKSKTAFFVVIL